MRARLFPTLLALAFAGSLALPTIRRAETLAAEEPAVIHFFWAFGCPHCAEEKVFLEELLRKYPGVELRTYETSANPQNAKLLQRAKEALGAHLSGVPFTVVGPHYFSGYLNDETTGQNIEAGVECALENGCNDVLSGLATSVNPEEPISSKNQALPETLTLPLLGEVKTKSVSLPTLTVILGLLDGFNPCAMWALLFLISLLLGMENRKRMWLLGGTFIATSALVYLFFMASWLSIFLFLGFVLWVRVGIGLLALGAGTYNIRDFFVNKEGTCKTVGSERKRKLLERFRAVTQERSLALALGGIALLAIAVNMIELVCSAGLPAIYTQVLSISNLPRWQYYGYLLLYVLLFMLDDLAIFFVTMKTLKMVGVGTKYARYSRLIGGLLMLAIGILLIFKPEILMFGG